MKKKGQMEGFGRIISYIILFLVLVSVVWILFSPKEGFFNKVQDRFEILQASIGLEERVSIKDFETKKDLKTDFDTFCEILKSSKDLKSCLITYPLFETLRESSIKLTSGENQLFVQLLNKDKQVVDSCTLENSKLCAIAGKNKAAQNFHSNYLWLKGIFDRTPPSCRPNCKPDFSEPSEIIISWEGTDYNEKSIEVIFKDGSTLKEDLEDANLIYKADKEHICFFPTYDGGVRCGASDEGLDDDCLLDEDEYIEGVFIQCLS